MIAIESRPRRREAAVVLFIKKICDLLKIINFCDC
jgi:hypothetical protein